MQVCVQYTINPTRFHHQMCPGPISTVSAAWPVCDFQHAMLSITLVSKQKSFLLPVKIQCYSYSFDIVLNQNMTPKLPDHPPMLREEIKFKNYICNKKSNILVFNYNIYCQIMNKFIIHSLRLLLPLIFGSWWLPYETPAAVSQHFTLYLFSIWEISCWNLLPC